MSFIIEYSMVRGAYTQSCAGSQLDLHAVHLELLTARRVITEVNLGIADSI